MERDVELMISFTIENKTVNVFQSENNNKPVIYLNTFDNEGEQIFQNLQKLNCPDFTLIEISNLQWNSDMVPWDTPPIFENTAPLNGGADDYIKILIERIIPEAEKVIKGKPVWNGIAGTLLLDYLQYMLFIRLMCSLVLQVCQALCGFRELRSIYSLMI